MVTRALSVSGIKTDFWICLNAIDADCTLIMRTIDSLVRGARINASIIILGSQGVLLEFESRTLREQNSLPSGFEFVPVEDRDISSALKTLFLKFGTCDFLWVDAGVVVPDGWDIRLVKIAYAHTKIGTVSPLCDSSALFALRFGDGASHPQLLEEVDKLLFQLSKKHYVELPCFFPGFFLLKRDAFELLQNFSFNGDGRWWWQLSQFFAFHGFVHVVCDHLFVEQEDSSHSRPDYCLDVYPLVQAVNSAHPLTGLRHAFSQECSRQVHIARMPGYGSYSVQLHIMHGWGGGLEQWVRDYCAADDSRINLVLKSVGTWGAFGQRLVLYADLEKSESLCDWQLGLPIRATQVTHLGYQQILEEIIADYGVDAVIVSSLIGHSLDALSTGKPTVIVGHDYYPYCPSLNIYYEGLCRECDNERISLCFKNNPRNRFFTNVFADEWQGLRDAYFRAISQHQVRIVAPTPSYRDNLILLDNRFNDVEFQLIPHGLRHEFPEILPSFSEMPESRLKILILGSLSVQKGGDLLRSCYQEILRFGDLFLLGCGVDGQYYQGKAGINVIPVYKRESLSQLVAEIQPDLSLLLSVCPETFSYTLSELMAMRIPVLATNLGAFADRIVDRRTGFLVDPKPQDLIAKLSDICNERSLLDEVRSALRAKSPRKIDDMVADYHRFLPLGEKALADYRVALAPVSRILTREDFLQHSNFIEYLETQALFLREKIISTPLLGPWWRKIALKFLSGTVLFLRFCHNHLHKIRNTEKHV